MIDIAQRRILIDGEPRLVIAGEIHYFRTPREQWEHRLDQLADVGCNTVASYIPWLWHELPDGTIDLVGRSRAERDLAAFLDLCAARGLWFIARPGPFQMAELKNEGLPHRLYREHPENRAGGLGRSPGPHLDRRLPRPRLPQGGRGLVRGGDAAAGAASPLPRRPPDRGPARQRDRDAGLGHQLPRPHRASAGRTARMDPGAPRRRRRDLPRPRARRGVGPRHPLPRRGLGRAPAARSHAVHAGPLRALRRRARGERRPARHRGRAAADQHPWLQRRQR